MPLAGAAWPDGESSRRRVGSRVAKSFGSRQNPFPSLGPWEDIEKGTHLAGRLV